MRKACLLALLAVLLILPTRPAEASGEIHGGYSLLRDSNSDETFTNGLLLGVGFSVGREVTVVGEFSRHSKDFKAGNVNVVTVEVKSYMAGLRFGGGFYAQFLVGGVSAGGQIFGISAESESRFGIQPGVGFDAPLSDAVAFRFGGDYRLVFGENKNASEWRGHVGVVFRFGRR